MQLEVEVKLLELPLVDYLDIPFKAASLNSDNLENKTISLINQTMIETNRMQYFQRE
jgi:hypothetical protein